MSVKINWYPLSAMLFALILWCLIVFGGYYIWKNYLGPRAHKVVHIIEVERSLYVK